MTNTPAPTVCLSFDFDAISAWVGTMGLGSAQYISRGEFAAEVAAPRVLDLLEREGVTSTWFIPGADAELYPDVCKRVRDAGHEIGHHGYFHEPPTALTEDQERAALVRGLDALDTVLGVRPTGYRSPAADLSGASLRLLAEHGFAYDSSLLGGDFEPYWATPEAVTPSSPSPIVEIPIGTINDFTLFEFAMVPPLLMPANVNLAALGRRWIEDFRFMCREVPQGVFAPVMHPQAIGRGSRLNILAGVITAAKEAGADFTTLNTAAESWKQRQAAVN